MVGEKLSRAGSKEIKTDDGLEKRSPEFRQFLAEQLFLPPKKWDTIFKNYVEEKYKFFREGARGLREAPAERKKEWDF